MKLRKLLILILISGVACTSPSRASAQQYAKPGKFDFYLFTLSWSPQFCATTRRETAECQVHGGNFVVHGLWPEFKNGSWPADCSSEPGPTNPQAEADIMPTFAGRTRMAETRHLQRAWRQWLFRSDAID